MGSAISAVSQRIIWKTGKKHRLLGPTPRFWFSRSHMGFENLHFCNFPGNTDTMHLSAMLWGPLLYPKQTILLLRQYTFPCSPFKPLINFFLLMIWIQMPVSRQKRTTTKNSSIPYHRCDKQLYYMIGKWVFNKMTAINITIITENILSIHELLF